jgi:ribonuclease HI
MENITLHTDGASKGNPGPSGIGVVLSDGKGRVVKEIGDYIGQTTNNVAEYTALIRGLEEALALGARSVRIKTDSELLVKQITGAYKVKAPHLRELNALVRGLMARFSDVSIAHVPREQNAAADKLASQAAEKAKPGKNAPLRRKDTSQETLGL